jgi:hypothetical protein
MDRRAFILLFLFQAAGWVIFAIEDPSQHGEIHFRGPDAVGIAGALVIVGYAVRRALNAKSRGELLYIAFATVSITLASFSDIYLLSGWQHWSAHVHHRTAIGIAVGIFATAGPPGISPKTDFARGLLAWQQIVDIVLVTVLFAVVAWRVEQVRRGTVSDG